MATEEHVNSNGGGLLKLIKDPLALIIFLVFQTVTFAVFLTTLNNSVVQISKDNAESKLTAYTKDDAHKDRELLDSRFARLQDKDEEITRRIALLEGQINELKARAQK